MIRRDPSDAEDGQAELSEGLIDLSGLSLRDLGKYGESILACELRRVLGPDLDDADAIAGWANSV